MFDIMAKLFLMFFTGKMDIIFLFIYINAPEAAKHVRDI